MSDSATYKKVRKIILILISVFTGLLHIAQYSVITLPSIMFYAWHLLLGLTLLYLYTPLSKKHPTRFLVLDWICAALSTATGLYVIFNFEEYSLAMQTGNMSTLMIATGIVLTVLVLEGARRVLGNILPLIAIITIIYALFGGDLPGLLGHRGYDFARIISVIFSDLGLYGTPIGVSASNVFLFILFAAFLGASGADKIFQDIAIASAGKKRGGPAKMAVIASCFFGTISGSAVANVVSTGAFTIPLMKRNGYSPRFAGAVEAVASTGGQIMPPIMGAAAFILADISGTPYATVCLAALLPALMYYVCLFKMVDLEAVKSNLKGLDPEDLPDLKATLKKSAKLFIPLAVLLFLLLVLQYTPMRAAIWAMLAIVVCGLLDKNQRMKFKDIITGFMDGAKGIIQVVAACATSGIVVGMFSLTGLGLKFSDFIVSLGGESVILSLVLSMLVCAVLGMGLPTTAAYIICATAIAPALISIGIAPLAAHLFLLYFASISAITPPVAVASYAAAGIAEENSLKVGLTAVKLGILGFVLPFVFALNPSYITFNFSLTTLATWVGGFVICYALAIVLQGHVESKINIIERIAFGAIVVVTMQESLIITAVGVAAFAVLYIFKRRSAKLQKS